MNDIVPFEVAHLAFKCRFDYPTKCCYCELPSYRGKLVLSHGEEKLINPDDLVHKWFLLDLPGDNFISIKQIAAPDSETLIRWIELRYHHKVIIQSNGYYVLNSDGIKFTGASGFEKVEDATTAALLEVLSNIKAVFFN